MGRNADGAGNRSKLLDRILESGCRRVAILGLHPRSGTRTVLAALVRELHRRELPFGVTSFPRLDLGDEMTPEPMTRIALPPGATIASAATGTGENPAQLELIESTRFRAPFGEVALSSVVAGGEFELSGPQDPAEMGATLNRLADLCGGLALVDGSWSRSEFAAPGVTDGVILVVGAGYSKTPERSAAAAKYVIETLNVPAGPRPARTALEDALSLNEVLLLDKTGSRLGSMARGVEDPVQAIGSAGGEVDSLVLPSVLGDDLLGPLLRTQFRCSLVVRDATRFNVAPVYFKAWKKSGGSFAVVHPVKLIAAATNPVNFTGQDADPSAFLALVSEALPDLPVHDAILESRERSRLAVWRFWE